MSDNIIFMVHVSCKTYNHAPYIMDAMKGFTMQETDFPFVCTIIDDASTDGEPMVIRKYLEDNFDLDDTTIARPKETDDYKMCFARHKTNHNCFFAVYYLKYNHYSIKKTKDPYLSEWTDTKYTAICEGDDYWIDPLKLQKQVSFLENSIEYGLIYTNHYNNIEGEISLFKEKGNTEFGQILIESGIGTLTTCFRTDIYNDYFRDIQPNDKNWLMGDAPLWKYFAFHTKIKFLPDYTAVYRVLPESASHSEDYRRRMDFIRSAYEMQSYFINRYVDDAKERTHYEKTVRKQRDEALLAVLYRNGTMSEIWDFIMDNKRELGCRVIVRELFRGSIKRYIISKL